MIPPAGLLHHKALPILWLYLDNLINNSWGTHHSQGNIYSDFNIDFSAERVSPNNVKSLDVLWFFSGINMKGELAQLVRALA